jgi:hypothetical protein
MALAANVRINVNVPSGGSSKAEMVRLERSLSATSNGKQSPTSSGSPPASRTKSTVKHERERRISKISRNDNAQGLFSFAFVLANIRGSSKYVINEYN